MFLSVADIKTRLGIATADTSQDDLLAIVLADAQAYFKDHCSRTDIPTGAQSLIDRLAVAFYGLNADQYKHSVSEGEYQSTNYTDDDIPKSIRRQLRPYRVVKLV